MPVWESMEWSHISWSSPEKNERILFLGDSILGGYGGTVEKALGDRFSIGKFISSKAVDNIYLIKEVELMIDEFGRNDSIKLVHVNNGLHGIWHLTPENYKICYDYYIQSIMEKTPSSKIVLALSTPVRVGGDEYKYHKINDRVLRENDVVRELGQKYSLTVNDLYSIVDKRQDYDSGDGLHFNTEGSQALAKQVLDVVTKELVL